MSQDKHIRIYGLLFLFVFWSLCPRLSWAGLKGKIIAVIYGGEKIGAFNQPQAMYFDPQRKRLYLVDTLNDRLLSFDNQYKFLSAFNAGGKLKTPLAMVRDRKGHIIVTNKGDKSVLIINVKEKKIKSLDLSHIYPPVVPHSLAIASNGCLCLLDKAYKRILIFSPETYQVQKIIEEEGSSGFSDIKVNNNLVYALDPIFKKVFIYSQKGNVVGSILLKGVAFPISLAVDRREHLYILDRHKGKVFIFDKQGKPMGEIGKRGWKEGKFYSPCYIFIDSRNILYVVDTGNNRVEVFKIK
ncbi:MAG TPA: 6-bladed beta-propeller [Candidatus Desulfofervidus auxilii]|uniref:6-bladed beta-propeller n=2 Tax=Desulfofervidus auxilii TaxID=1621989 RepID=A0A7C1W4S6_DESA2|nr:6-bladed beta-propeller [Candidatus Desulfofervidus auxilii]